MGRRGRGARVLLAAALGRCFHTGTLLVGLGAASAAQQQTMRLHIDSQAFQSDRGKKVRFSGRFRGARLGTLSVPFSQKCGQIMFKTGVILDVDPTTVVTRDQKEKLLQEFNKTSNIQGTVTVDVQVEERPLDCLLRGNVALDDLTRHQMVQRAKRSLGLGTKVKWRKSKIGSGLVVKGRPLILDLFGNRSPKQIRDD